MRLLCEPRFKISQLRPGQTIYTLNKGGDSVSKSTTHAHNFSIDNGFPT